MRLLNVETMQLEVFNDCFVAPPYTILSHTWGEVNEEITFQDFETAWKNNFSLKETFANHPTKKIGWAKVEGACRQVRENNSWEPHVRILQRHQPGIQHIWIDTCCIDKSSSSELHEAINSMFSWYQHSVICFIYLADVIAEQDLSKQNASFRSARWFTRGWTLHELIAPSTRYFLNKDWEEIGSMTYCNTNPQLLGDLIDEITGISVGYLFNITSASVAERMSWAARRQTSRQEDAAYCLLGIFGIHMPMLYGEGGTRAFVRLQEEIMKMTDDCSLLSWGLDCQGIAGKSSQNLQPESSPEKWGSLLAPHPKYFSDSANISSLALRGFPPPSFSAVQRGWKMQLPLVVDKLHEHVAYGILACGFGEFLVAIPLISCNTIKIKSTGLIDWNRGGRDIDQFQREYIRPAYSKPYLVLKEFLNVATEEQIVIRRISEAWFNPQFVHLPIKVDCQHFRILIVYPPQPVTDEGLLISLKSFPSDLDDSSTLETSGLKSLKGQEIPAPTKKIAHFEPGRILLFVESKSARLLIVLDFGTINVTRNDVGHEIGYANRLRSFDKIPCQIFQFNHGKHLYLEDLQSMASSWDFRYWLTEKLTASEKRDLRMTVLSFHTKDSSTTLVETCLGRRRFLPSGVNSIFSYIRIKNNDI